MNIVIFILIFLPVIITALAQAPDSIFSVVAPFTIQQDKPYHVDVRGHKLKSNVILTASLTGKNIKGVDINIEKIVEISPDSPSTGFSISTSKIKEGKYSFVVEGKNYLQRRTLTYNTRKYVFMIQFNKAIHLPGDTLQYRIFAIDSETNAANPKEKNNITISDPKGNLVTLIKNVVFTKGKYENIFQLSPKTAYGEWTMKFQSGYEIVEKNFEVAEYELPLITGKLSIPRQNLYSSGKVQVTVDISYTFNANPVGTAQINFTKYGQTVLEKNILINTAKTTFDVDILTELQLTYPNNCEFEAMLYFEDPLTKEKVFDIKSFSVQTKVFNIFVSSDENLKPGSPFTFTIALRKYDGSPAPAGTKILIIPENTTAIPEQTLILSADGKIASSVDVGLDVEYLIMRVIVDGAYDHYISANLPWKGEGSFLELQNLNQYCRIDSECLKINEPIFIKLISGELIDYATVHITSKGVLLKSLTVWFDSDSNEDDDPKTVVFSFKPTIWYVPFVQIVAYYINGNGSFVSGRAEFKISNGLPNYVKIRPSQKNVAPGSNAKFNIESYVNSTVSLVAVDGRSLVLRSDGNITKEHVFRHFEKYFWNYRVNYDWNNIQSHEYNFGDLGLLLMSNALRNSSKNESNGDSIAFDFSSSPDAIQHIYDPKHLKIREDFSESFLWRDVDIVNKLHNELNFAGESSKFGYESIVEKVPDSITNYHIFGVSMSSIYGLGLSEEISSLSVFMKFFISAEFPFEMKRNETLVQDIDIFNYLPVSQSIEVKITSDPGYDTADLSTYGWTAFPGFYNKTITTTVGEHIKLQFVIIPRILGVIQIEITARGPIAGDGVKKQLRVVQEGIRRSITRSVLIPIEKPTSNFLNTLHCDLPSSAYELSTEISATVTGDIFGKALKNINKLIIYPSGCCEQIASALIPNIVVYLYLSAANKLTTDLKVRLESNIANGYQNLIRCQNADGSYSIFTGRIPSTWVTAYIIQHLYLITDIVTVDPNIISRGADYLLTQQNTDGSFNETGSPIYYIKPGSKNETALTAFCSIALSSILSKYPQYAVARDNAVTNLEERFSSASSTYQLGIITYALYMAGSKKAGKAYSLFYARRSETTTTISWSIPLSQQSGYVSSTKSQDIEITGYALMAFIKRGEVLSKTLKVANYIISQSNLYGGFISSHDTTIALNALSQFASIYALNGTVNLKLTPDVGEKIKAKVTPENALTLKTFQLDSEVRTIAIQGSSDTSGLAIVSLTCNFYEDPEEVIPQFDITYHFREYCRNYFTIHVCVSYNQYGLSNMALLEVTMPSGYTGNAYNSADVRLIEHSNQNTQVTFYFDNISNDGTCVYVYGNRNNNVTGLKNGLIQAYDYYDTSKQGVASYPIPLLSSKC